MVENVKLFINDKLVEFSTDPKVLFTYQVKDNNNPTVVKNTFSKTLTIDGTPNNNDIFGQYWKLERYLLNGGDGGAFFNSSKKAPFQLYIGSDLYEEGYCKLDNISRNGEDIKYSVTLYGGLGDFFFNLSTSDSGDQKKLSDLTYMPSGTTEEFDFTVGIDTVKKAWDVLKGTANPNFAENRKWKYINFMPAYNGKPDNFDSDKVIINLSGTSLSTSVKNADDGKYYTPKRNFTIGTLPQEMTEWDLRDLRSYLQRPVIKMSSIINACCDPTQNGGYTVNLDTDFFNENNPYWNDTWMTLPLVTNIEYSNDQQIMESASAITYTTTGQSNGLMYQDIGFDLGEINGNVSNITINAKIKPNGQYIWFCPYTSYVWFWNYNGNDYHTGNWCLGSLFCQLIALNGDTVVGASNTYNLSTPIRHNGNLYYGHNGHYPDSTGYDSNTGLRKMGNGSKYVPYMDKPIYTILGKFTDNGFVKEINHDSNSSTYDSNAYTFTFSIDNIGTNVTGLKMVYYWGATADKIDKAGAPNKLWDRTYDDAWMFRPSIYDYRPIEVSEHNLVISSHNMSAVMGESLGRTGTKVTKQLLLNTESSPCDYLLSYCKMFGLHFTKDIGSKTINILTRKSFYNRADIVDLGEYVDLSKQVDIQPIMFKSKWYQFLQEKDETDVSKKYLTAKGVEYGSKVLDTGYEFNADKIDLLEDNCIKSGIEVLEKSKWFTAYNNDDSLRPWMNVGLKYTLWNQDDEFEVNAGVGSTGDILPINEGDGMKYYDIFPKLQFHDSDNAPTDGNNCLVFFSGFKNLNSGRVNKLTYILSDDSVYQTVLNEGTPCWLFTKYESISGNRICYKLSSIPVFERYLTSENSGVISKSLDFGSAQELYIPNYTLTDDSNIYHSYWRTYLSDLFDVNTKQMTAYVRMDSNPGVEWLRRFYWYDNGLWIINKVNDWNPASYDTTKVEFIKVQNLSDYSSVTQQRPNTIQLSASTYNIAASGGSATLYITGIENNVTWKLSRTGNANVGYMAPTSGVGESTSTIVFGATTTTALTNVYITVTRNDNAVSSTICISQGYPGQQSVSVTPTPIILSYTGNTVEYEFTWFNQGDQYITGATTSGTVTISSIDTTTKQEENKASVVYGSNSTTGITNGAVTFVSTSGDSVVEQVYQMPESYTFDGTGSTIAINLGVTGATFDNVPYWLSTSNNGSGTYYLKAEANATDESRSGVTRIVLNDTYADFNVYQGIISSFNVMRIDGSGNVLVTGGTIQLKVTSTTAWTGTSNVAWATLSSSSASTSATITVTFGNNTGGTRDAVFTFTNASGEVITYTQTQAGKDGGGDSLVTPTTLAFPATGGTSALTVDIQNNWRIVAYSPWLSCNVYSGSTSCTVNVTASPYSSQEMRQGVLVFYDVVTTKTYQVLVIQNGADVEILAVSPSRLTFPASGGTLLLTIISNTDWTIA